MNSSNTYCSLPFETLDIETSGNYRICCDIDWTSAEATMMNLIKDDYGNPYKIFDKKPSEIFNNIEYTSLRKNMIDGKKSIMCKSCYEREENTKSYDEISRRKRYYPIENNVNENVIIDAKKIRRLFLRMGNLCNLKCRMCNPYSSSLWVDDWNDMVKKTNALMFNKRFGLMDDETKNKLNNYEWSKNDNWIKNIEEIADGLTTIDIAGGEPTLFPEQYKLYDMLIEKDCAKNIRLHLTSNLTNIPNKFLDYIKHFKKIIITASIDGYDDINRYIRYPTAWSSVEKNLKKYCSYDNVSVRLACVVQLYNIMHLYKLLDWIKNSRNIGIKFDVLLFTCIRSPTQLDIRILPEKLKDMAFDRLKPYIEDIDFSNRGTLLEKNKKDCAIKAIVDWMYSSDQSQKLNNFFAYTTAVDIQRNESLLNIAPEFEPYYTLWKNYVIKNKHRIS